MKLNRNRIIYRENGVTIINWKLVPLMKHLPEETLESAKITARNDVKYLTRRAGEIPKEIQILINSPFDKII